MIVKRLLTGVALVLVVIAAVMFKWLFNIAILTFIILGLYEFFTMLEKKGIYIYKYFGIAIGAAIPLFIMFDLELTRKWELLSITLLVLSIILMQFKRRKSSGVTVDISTTLFGIIYVAWFLSFLIKIRYLPGGAGLLASVLLMTKAGDIGAYFTGMRFGKTPLIPRISPKKSVEGSCGGLLFSILAAMACQPFLGFSYMHLALIGLAMGILGQLGDLSESLIKRDCEVKDSGKILPGMGGMLDELDSLLFTAPVFYFYISIFLG